MRQTSLGDVLRMASEKPPELWVAGARMLGFEPAGQHHLRSGGAPPVSPLARPDEDESIRPVTARTHAPSGVADGSELAVASSQHFRRARRAGRTLAERAQPQPVPASVGWEWADHHGMNRS